MIFLIVLLSLVIVSTILLLVFKKDWVATIFGNSITSKVEKKKKVENKIQVLKKEQKMKTDKIVAEYKSKEEAFKNNATAQINSLKARIKTLENEIKVNSDVLLQERKVELDKVTHEYDEKIINQQNLVNRLSNFIGAEKKNMEDAITNTQPNAPTSTRILLEDKITNKKVK